MNQYSVTTPDRSGRRFVVGPDGKRVGYVKPYKREYWLAWHTHRLCETDHMVGSKHGTYGEAAETLVAHHSVTLMFEDFPYEAMEV